MPTHPPGGSAPSGTVAGTMASTNVIYSNIMDVAKMDDIGLEVTWTGTPTGTFEVMASNSGINFYPLTFSPTLDQPTGASGGYVVNISVYAFKYIMLRYTNVSGTGTLTVYGQNKSTGE